jgi:hypothetical protein
MTHGENENCTVMNFNSNKIFIKHGFLSGAFFIKIEIKLPNFTNSKWTRTGLELDISVSEIR